MKIFISHCGINSVYGSVRLGTLVICVPLFFDQYIMAYSVRNGSVRTLLDKFNFTSDELKAKIE